MNQKNELPPGWGERFQENPWGNVQQQSHNPFKDTKQSDAKAQSHPFDQKSSDDNAEKPSLSVPSADFDLGTMKHNVTSLWASAGNTVHSIQDNIKSPKKPKRSVAESQSKAPHSQAYKAETNDELPPTLVDPYRNESNNEEPDTVSPLIIIIPLLVGIIAFLAGLFFMRARQQKDHSDETAVQMHDVPVQEEMTSISEMITAVPNQIDQIIPSNTTMPMMAMLTKPISITEPVPAGHAEPEMQTELQKVVVQEPVSLPDDPASSEFDLKAEYRSIVNREGAEINTGYYADVNGDGQNELILKNPIEMNFHMYTYDSEMHEIFFGYYSSMNEAKLFHVPTANGQYYFYWRCNYKLYSLQGYYDPLNNSEIDIGINYNFEDHAEWQLWFNNNEYASGREEGSSTYGETPNCYQRLLAMFQDYSFQIYDDSDYKKLDCLDKAALLRAIQ